MTSPSQIATVLFLRGYSDSHLPSLSMSHQVSIDLTRARLLTWPKSVRRPSHVRDFVEAPLASASIFSEKRTATTMSKEVRHASRNQNLARAARNLGLTPMISFQHCNFWNTTITQKTWLEMPGNLRHKPMISFFSNMYCNICTHRNHNIFDCISLL